MNLLLAAALAVAPAYVPLSLPGNLPIVPSFAGKPNWLLYAPPGKVAVAPGGRVRFTVDDSGDIGFIDKAVGRDAQHVEIARKDIAPNAKVDFSFRVTPRFTNTVSRDHQYVVLGQVGQESGPGVVMKGPPVGITMHGQMHDGREQVRIGWNWNNDPTGANPQSDESAFFPFELNKEHSVRIIVKIGPAGDGMLRAKVDGVWVVNKKHVAIGYRDAQRLVLAIGPYVGEHGIPKGSGKRMVFDYRAVSFTAR